jgi:hypothetical protein
MPAKKSRPTYRQPHPRCNFQFADGRRCRMLRDPRQTLCLFHHRELLQLQSAEEIGAELLALGGNFQDPIALNFVLGKLFAHVATGRMHRRQASTLAYIAQLLLQTLDTRRYNLARDRHDYRALIPALNSLYDPAPIADRSATPGSTVVAPPFSSPRGTKGAASSVTAAPSVASTNNGASSITSPVTASSPEGSQSTPAPAALLNATTTHAHQPPQPHPRL